MLNGHPNILSEAICDTDKFSYIVTGTFSEIATENDHLMHRFFLAILLFLSTFAVVAHGTLVYKYSATAFFIADEETSDEQPSVKEAKEVCKETIGFTHYLYRQPGCESLYKSLRSKLSCYSKGFYNTPYNPPDAI